MKATNVLVVVVMVSSSLVLVNSSAWAREKTRSGDVTKQGPGSYTVDGTRTTSTGKTGTFSREVSKTKTGDTTTRETIVTGPRGQEHEYTESATVDEPYDDE